MKHPFLIGVVAMALVVLPVSCEKKRDIIPLDELSQLFEELYMVDQYIDEHPSLRAMAETTFVYQEFIERRGYTVDQYVASIDYYCDDSEPFARMYMDLEKRLDERERDLNKEIENREKVNVLPARFRAAGFNPIWTRDSAKLFDNTFIIEFMDSLTKARSESFFPDAVKDTTARVKPVEKKSEGQRIPAFDNDKGKVIGAREVPARDSARKAPQRPAGRSSASPRTKPTTE